MKAKDVMTTKVVAVVPEMSVSAIATLLLERRISAVPVIGGGRCILGIVSEGDLIRRSRTAQPRSPRRHPLPLLRSYLRRKALSESRWSGMAGSLGS